MKKARGLFRAGGLEILRGLQMMAISAEELQIVQISRTARDVINFNTRFPAHLAPTAVALYYFDARRDAP